MATPNHNGLQLPACVCNCLMQVHQISTKSIEPICMVLISQVSHQARSISSAALTKNVDGIPTEQNISAENLIPNTSISGSRRHSKGPKAEHSSKQLCPSGHLAQDQPRHQLHVYKPSVTQTVSCRMAARYKRSAAQYAHAPSSRKTSRGPPRCDHISQKPAYSRPAAVLTKQQTDLCWLPW